MIKNKLILILVAAMMILTACTPRQPSADSEGIKVVASTTIVGDVVRQIGGEHISLTVLYPVGTDPHSFEPRPQDAAAISDAQIVFLNGLELEHSLEPILEANARGSIIEVSEGIEAIPFEESLSETTSSKEEHDHAAGDPHTWMDPTLVIVWVNNITSALCQADPDNAEYFNANADAYIKELTDLDQWIQTEIEAIPQENRRIVTDHESLGYFVKRYGFELTGLVVASLSSGASPSAQELAALENTIREQNVPAIFVGNTVNPALAEQVAQDTGIKVIPIYSGSLGDQDSGVNTYIQFMKTNVLAIVEGLK